MHPPLPRGRSASAGCRGRGCCSGGTSPRRSADRPRVGACIAGFGTRGVKPAQITVLECVFGGSVGEVEPPLEPTCTPWSAGPHPFRVGVSNMKPEPNTSRRSYRIPLDSGAASSPAAHGLADLGLLLGAMGVSSEQQHRNQAPWLDGSTCRTHWSRSTVRRPESPRPHEEWVIEPWP